MAVVLAVVLGIALSGLATAAAVPVSALRTSRSAVLDRTDTPAPTSLLDADGGRRTAGADRTDGGGAESAAEAGDAASAAEAGDAASATDAGDAERAGAAGASETADAAGGEDSTGGTDGAAPRRPHARWVWPTGSTVVLRPFDPPLTDHGKGHRGIDVEGPIGTSVVAPAAGTVSFAGAVGGREVVAINHGDGLVSSLDSVAPLVAVGAAVAQGQEVGRVAAGHCPASAPCLHLGARVDDRYVDPLPFLPAPAWPVLLPLPSRE